MAKHEFSLAPYEKKEVLPANTGRDYIDWGLHAIGAPAIWPKTKGEGIKVAVLDTGVDLTHPDLRDNIKKCVSFVGGSADDREGHGTHVAGIIAGVDNDVGMIGVAPEAELYIAKVLGDHGSGSFDAIIKGVQWAVEQGADIINMSLGTAVEPPKRLHEEIQKAHRKGVILVAATGNENTQVSWPARYDEVIAVSALDQEYQRAKFSNYGIKNEIIAPGVDIISTYKNGTYAKLSGTSMATPIVSGAAALYLSYQRKIGLKTQTTNQVYEALIQSTIDLGNTGKDHLYGYGLISLLKLIY